MSTVWLITSGKGGVGKTTLTACLGRALAASGQRVCVLDADIGLRDLDILLGVENRIVYDLLDLCGRDCTPDQALIPVDGLWVFVYFGSFLFWTVCFVLTAREDRRTAHRLLGGNMIAKLICFAVFMILPTTNTRPDVSGPGLGNFLLRLLYFIDDPVNLFPSMHCYMSWYGARWLGRRRNRTLPGVIAAYVISFLIFYSTMATRQHYILDVISGVAVAEIALWLEPRLDPARVYDRIDRAVMKW